MDQSFIRKYFEGQCSDKELEQVLDWFRTSQGRAFLKEQIRKDCRRFTENNVLFLYPDIPSDKIFDRIQKSKRSVEQEKAKDYRGRGENHLKFEDESLSEISRQLEHIYNVKIEFKSDQLKKLNLTADLKKKKLDDTLQIIADLLDINFKKGNSNIIWISY